MSLIDYANVEWLKNPHLLCFWDFQEDAGTARVSQGKYAYRLHERGAAVQRADGGIFGPYSAELTGTNWLEIPRECCPALNIYGASAQVSILAWVKRKPSGTGQCEAIAGMWNESLAQRQYCLFMNLKHYGSADQVCGHISSVGGPTPGNRWCIDASIGQTPVGFDDWQFIAFTYDGSQVRSYLNGIFDRRPQRNPYDFDGGIFDSGEQGSDFTVGAVHRLGEMGNWYKGNMGGLAIFDIALTEEEMYRIYSVTMGL